MDSAVIRIGDHEYHITQLSAKKQWHVLRRIAPALTQSADAVRKGLTLLRGDGEGDLFSAFGPIAEALHSLSDEDSDYVFDTCLGVCKRRAGSGPSAGWAPVYQSGQLIYQDMTLAQQLELIFYVLRESLTSFFTEGLGRFQGALDLAPNT